MNHRFSIFRLILLYASTVNLTSPYLSTAFIL